MLFVTTVNYDQLGTLIKNKFVSLDNDSLIFGQSFESVCRYVKDRMGSDGYVFGIRGRINPKSVELLSRMDAGLRRDKLILQADVKEEDALRFSVRGLDDAVQILTYGLPDELLHEQMDNSLVRDTDVPGIEIVCVPAIRNTGNIRITTLNRDIKIDAEGITFVRLTGGRKDD